MTNDAADPTAARMAPAFESFMRERERLNNQLDISRREIDRWFEGQVMPAPLSAVARLEVLLVERRDLLGELARVDDNFVVYIVNMRNASGSVSS